MNQCPSRVSPCKPQGFGNLHPIALDYKPIAAKKAMESYKNPPSTRQRYNFYSAYPHKATNSLHTYFMSWFIMRYSAICSNVVPFRP